MPALFRRHQHFLIISASILAVFIILNLTSITNGSPLISQVQTSGTGSLSKQDFIKLFNPDQSPFNLKGYRLIKRTKTSTSDTSIKSFTTDTFIAAGSYFTWANSDEGFADSLGADTATSQTLASDNGIALRQGAADEGVIIDSVAWGEADNGLAEGAIFATNPAPGQILTRRNNLDTNNNAADFYLAEPSANANTNSAPAPSTTSGSATTNYLHQIFINELVSDPSEEDTEWVELYNASSQSFNLDGWTLEDGSGTKTTLAGTIYKYLVIDSPKGNLNNTGDKLLLKDPSGQIIDELSYGNWSELETNAPVAKKPNSLALKTDGLNTNNYLNDWTITATPTKNSTNLITNTDNDQISESAPSSSHIKDCPLIINEVLPDPLGADQVGEFIELYNPGTTAVDLIGWSLSTPNQLPFVFGLQSLPALNYLTLPRSITRLILANDGNTLELYQPRAEKACFKFKYTQSSPGASFGYNDDTLDWSKPRQLWSRQPTPGGKNSNLHINQVPKAVINHSLNGPVLSFDASDSTDPNADQLIFQWSFGDGESSTELAGTHHYKQPGDYQVSLSVSDGSLGNQAKINLHLDSPDSNIIPITVSSPTLPSIPNKSKSTTKASSSAKTSTVKKTSSPSSSSGNSSNLQLTGTVLDRPGTFSSLYFFLLPDGETQAWQIYRQKGQLPDLQPGQRLTATGRRSSIANIKRLLISEVSNLQLHELSPSPLPTTITLEQANAHLGQLVTISGEVTDRAKDNFYLDDGQAELLIRLKAGTGLTTSQFNPGSDHTLSGLLVMGASAIELWPRSLADTDLNQNSKARQLSSTSLPLNNNQQSKTELLAHFLIGLGAILAIIAIIIFKKSQNKG